MYVVLTTLGRELHKTEPFVPEPSPFDVEFVIVKLNKLKIAGYLSNCGRTDPNRR
jgi:hypothetical protein